MDKATATKTLNNPNALVFGIDLGDRVSHACALDRQSGEVVERFKFKTTREGVSGAFAEREASLVALEVGGHSRWLAISLAAMGHEVVVANPRALRIVYTSRRKNDVGDAEKLARLARSDVELLSPVTHRDAEANLARTVLKARDVQVRARTQHINAVRGFVKSYGLRMPACSAASFAKKASCWLEDGAVDAELRLAIEPLIASIAELTGHIRRYDKQIAQLIENAMPEAKALLQVGGVGPVTALAFTSTIADAGRFKHSRDVGAYLGLVPRQDQSGRVDKQLGITKTGDTMLRRLLVQCAQYILGPFGAESDLRAWGLKLAERGGGNAKKRAVVAVARKLAVLLHRLMATGEVYEPIGYVAKRTAA
jgi:transposase